MNDDLISKQEVLNKLNELDQQELYLPCHFKEFVIDEVPNIPQKTGRWKHVEIESNKSDTGYFMLPLCECSVCDIYVEQESNYCPNCGADMRSKAREYLEYGELITKGVAQGLRGDSDERFNQ